jgi:hypothetical protein
MRNRIRHLSIAAATAILGLLASQSPAETTNLRVVTDASPDYTDLPSLVHSATDNFEKPADKCWAMFYWNHIARRQTNPMMLHGTAHTDPIRQFNDYGFTMCSTISGIEQSIWEQMGLKHRYWDISNHTVGEVFYDGKWHMYDNSMSALYTLCDGKTIASVEDIGKTQACEKSHGKAEPGHIAKYHCLTATGPNGSLTGADGIRSVDEEYRCFNPNGLKLRTYYFDWENGHRYILNLKPGESYTRSYSSLGDTPEFWVGNEGKDPEKKNPRYHLRGNGQWEFVADLSPAGFAGVAHSVSHVAAAAGGLHPDAANTPAEIIYKIQSANVTTGQEIDAQFARKPGSSASISVSHDNGLHWTEAWKAADDAAANTASLKLQKELTGAYEILVKVSMTAKADPADVVLQSLKIRTVTEVNSKTLPRLNIGRNTVYVGAGEQTESIVFWPELEGDKYKEMIVEEKNVTSTKKHPGYQGTLYASVPKEDGYVVYRLDAPSDITKLTLGGRFSNRFPKSHIDLFWSADEGKTWTKTYSLTNTEQPWDVIHYDTVQVPAGHKSVWVKYLMNTSQPGQSNCGIYSVRMEANYKPADTTPRPIDVTFRWQEKQEDGKLVDRSHTQRVDKLPATYTIDVGGVDHPVMKSITTAIAEAGAEQPKLGYSDGKASDANAKKWIGRWITTGNNLAVGKPYTVSHPSADNWGAGDPDGKKLTDGVVGPTYSGGTSFMYGLIWKEKTNPEITLDLGEAKSCASFGLNFHGYRAYDVLKGEVKDKVEVLTSEDGKTFTSRGFLQTDIKRKDIPVNFMLPDEETLCGDTFRVIPEKPVQARYVKYRVTSARMFCATEIEVLDSIKYEPYDFKIALPK